MKSRLLARVIAICTLTVFVASLGAVAVIERVLFPNESGFEDPSLVIGSLSFAVVGVLLVIKRPENRVGWIMVAIPGIGGLFFGPEGWAAYQAVTRGRVDALGMFGVWGNSWYWYVFLSLLFTYLPLLFPDGRLPSPRWRWPVRVFTAGLLTVVVMAALTPTLSGQDVDYRIDNPIGIAGMPDPEQSWPLLGVLLAGVIGGFLAVAMRFRRSTGLERQQLKWFLAAAATLPLAPIGDFIQPLEWVSDLAFALAVIGFPVAVGVAVLRYRLFEIDRILSRTLTYALVTAVLLAIYGLVTVLPGTLFDLRSDLLVAMATLASAAAFGPVRRRIQTAVDRRFNRARYDARRTVEDFGTRLRDEIDLADLSLALQQVVSTSMQPSRVRLWLRASGAPRVAETGSS